VEHKTVQVKTVWTLQMVRSHKSYVKWKKNREKPLAKLRYRIIHVTNNVMLCRTDWIEALKLYLLQKKKKKISLT
jgi:hypothetical protein